MERSITRLHKSSVTDSGGNYLFTGLGAGDYTDSLVVPNGYLATGPTSHKT